MELSKVTRTRYFISIAGVILIIAILFFFWQKTQNADSSPIQHTLKPLVPGVKAYTISKCGCTSDEKRFIEMLQYVNANDEHGLTELADNDNLFLLKPETEVLVINAANELGGLDVRVLAGKYEGQRCILPVELVK